MKVFPLLIRPYLLAIRNRWRSGTRQSLKQSGTLLLSLAMMAAIYISTLAALREGSTLLKGAEFDPVGPLSILLSSLFLMLFLASSISAIGSLFLSNDLDLLLSSPISKHQFILGKTLEVGFSTGWMLLIFGLPSLFAFGQLYQPGILFFIVASTLCITFLTFAVVLGVFCALLFGTLLPPQRSRVLFLLLFIGSLALFFGSLNSPAIATQNVATGVLPSGLMQMGAVVSSSWSPSFYCSRAIIDLGAGHYKTATVTLLFLIGVITATWLMLSVLCSLCYEHAYSRVRSQGTLLRVNSRASQRAARFCMPLCCPQSRAIITKEYKLFSRDITHTIQLAMLLAICFIYLYNFKALQTPPNAREEVVQLWQTLLLLVNIALSFLVMTSICSRFVFPSLSLEGSSFWILQSAPISIKKILRAKLRSWVPPISIISGVVFISGAMALDADGPLLLASCASGVIMCYGLIALAIGLGSLLARFEWEYASQISTNMGSFIFMVISMLFLGVNLLPITFMYGAYIIVPELFPHPDSRLIVIGIALITLLIINKIIASISLSIGAKALAPK